MFQLIAIYTDVKAGAKTLLTLANLFWLCSVLCFAWSCVAAMQGQPEEVIQRAVNRGYDLLWIVLTIEIRDLLRKWFEAYKSRGCITFKN